MSSIKGLEIKGLTKFRGHEGEPLRQGNIYLKGKKVGFYSDGDWGGCATISYDSKEIEAEIQAITVQYFKENPPDYTFANTDDYLLSAVIDLALDEKDFKSALKKGYVLQLVADSVYEEGKPQPMPITYSIPPKLSTPDELAKFRSELQGKGYNKFTEFKSLEDFIIE